MARVGLFARLMISDAGRTIATAFSELFGEGRVVSVVIYKADL